MINQQINKLLITTYLYNSYCTKYENYSEVEKIMYPIMRKLIHYAMTYAHHGYDQMFYIYPLYHVLLTTSTPQLHVECRYAWCALSVYATHLLFGHHT